MIPLRDTLPTRRTPWVTYLLIALNVAAFLFTISRPDAALTVIGADGQTLAVDGFEASIVEWGLVPCELTAKCTANVIPEAAISGDGRIFDVAVPAHAVLLTLVTSMFLHGGWLHLGGNMLYLWIFGNNVEDAMGRARFVLFYLLGGLIAGLAQVVVDVSSNVPNVGASGAIAAVLGGYLLLFPRARVLCWFILVFELPAVVPLVLWIVLQLREGAASFGGALGDQGGVAYWAHIGGFAAGMLLIRLFARGRRHWNGRTYVWTDDVAAAPQGPFLR